LRSAALKSANGWSRHVTSMTESGSHISLNYQVLEAGKDVGEIVIAICRASLRPTESAGASTAIQRTLNWFAVLLFELR
jgi:hypothetical protein